VTFLPDGSALAPAAPARFGVGKRRFLLRIDRWSGRPSLDAVSAIDADEGAGDGLDDAPDEWPDAAPAPGGWP
jgi:hypothetical protein